MPKFSYRAINETGATVTGVIEAETRDAAANALSSRGYIPSRISREAAASSFTINRINTYLTPIRAWDLILFTKQLSTMLRAGIPIIRLFHILENQTENRKLKSIITQQTQDIEGGQSLYEAFRKHPSAFSPLYCSMIQAGEASGSLPEVMDRLIRVIEHEYKIKSEVRSALAYPILVFSLLVVAFFILLTYVVPKFVDIFIKTGIEIPLPTRICMIMYSFLFSYWYIFAVVTVVAVSAIYMYFRTSRGRFVRDYILVRLPLVGPVFVKAAMSRFAGIFAILQKSGIAVLEIIRILSGAIGNQAISRTLDQLSDKLREGRGIAEPLRSAEFFTPMVVNMIAVGEESGNLDEMLADVSRHYDMEVEYATKRLTMALGPILVLGLAVVVGFFALAIYLPMWDLSQMVR